MARRDSRVLEIERTTSTGHRLSHYDGVCGNIHGHNMRWEVRVDVDFDPDDDAAMQLDLKDISDVIDVADHSLLLNEKDPLLDHDVPLGDRVVTFDSDPTCEKVSQWMADRILETSPHIQYVELTLYETEKYAVRTEAHE